MSIPEVQSKNRLLQFIADHLNQFLINLDLKGNVTAQEAGIIGDITFGSTRVAQASIGTNGVLATFANSGNGISIDTAGHVTTSTQPGFSARLTSDQAIAADDWTTVVFDTEDFDTGGDYAVGNGQFTAPVSGKYLFAASCRMDDIASNTTAYPWARFYNNSTGKQYRHSLYDVSNRERAYWSLGGAIVMDLTAGHVVTYDVFNKSDATTLEVGSNTGTIEYNWFTGYLLG